MTLARFTGPSITDASTLDLVTWTPVLTASATSILRKVTLYVSGTSTTRMVAVSFNAGATVHAYIMPNEAPREWIFTDAGEGVDEGVSVRAQGAVPADGFVLADGQL